MQSWVEFWDGEHAIYVNDRHKQLHARAIGRDFVGCIPAPTSVVLDHGCGEALYASDVAVHCRRLILCEAAEGLRVALAERVRDVSNIEVVDPAGVEALQEGTLDLVVANSLAQYLTREELEALLKLWRRKLSPSGTLVVGDVIPPNVSPVADVAALVRFGWIGGFLWAALGGLVRTALSDYRKVRKQLGLSTYTEADFLALLADEGFRAERVQPNFGHNQGRMTFRAVPA